MTVRRTNGLELWRGDPYADGPPVRREHGLVESPSSRVGGGRQSGRPHTWSLPRYAAGSMDTGPLIRLARLGIATALVFSVAIGVGHPQHVAAQGSGIDSVEPWFEWSMPDRYGIDGDRDGLVDMPNTESYVHGTVDSRCVPACPDPVFPVAFEAHLGDSVAPAAFPMIRYEWTLRPAAGPAQSFARHAPQLIVSLPEGSVTVTLRVVVDLPFRSFGLSTTDGIEVRDILIVAIGDSYGSGEGNPEARRGTRSNLPTWGDGRGSRDVDADHAQARRSSIAWPSQLAIDLERSDPRSSVTFISVAASGATVDEGLLGPQSSRLPLAQVPRVAALVGEREIDLLLISIGGNDIGFAQVIAALVDADAWLDPLCYENDLRNTWASVSDGDWNRVSRLSWKITDPFRIRCRTAIVDGRATLPGLDGLPAEIDRLAARLAEVLHPDRTLVLEYPDPTGYSDGVTTGICDEIVGDAAPLGLHEINREEQRLGRSEVLDPLNRALRAAAERHGWDYLGGVVDAFTDGHGYCAEWPDYGYPPEFTGRSSLLTDRLDYPDSWYRNAGIRGTATQAGPVGWYRTAGQSVVLQGPDSRIDTTGTMHPNELGHRALANLALALLARG